MGLYFLPCSPYHVKESFEYCATEKTWRCYLYRSHRKADPYNDYGSPIFDYIIMNHIVGREVTTCCIRIDRILWLPSECLAWRSRPACLLLTSGQCYQHPTFFLKFEFEFCAECGYRFSLSSTVLTNTQRYDDCSVSVKVIQLQSKVIEALWEKWDTARATYTKVLKGYVLLTIWYTFTQQKIQQFSIFFTNDILQEEMLLCVDLFLCMEFWIQHWSGSDYQ